MKAVLGRRDFRSFGERDKFEIAALDIFEKRSRLHEGLEKIDEKAGIVDLAEEELGKVFTVTGKPFDED